MRLLLVIPAILGCTAPLLAQNLPAVVNDPAQDPAAANCTVSGRVVSAADGNPLKSALVVLVPEQRHPHSQVYSASSDSEGHFTLQGVPPGRYQFLASHNGFVEQHYKAGPNDEGPIFSLSRGENVSDVLFRLTLAAVISGRIVNEDGDPMPRVEVVALHQLTEEESSEDEDSTRHRKAQMNTVGSAQTDDRGFYRIFGLRPGEYLIRADDALLPMGRVGDESYWIKREIGSEYAGIFFPSATQASQAQVIPLKAGEEAQADVALRRVRTAGITGRLVGPNGPANGAIVTLQAAEDDGSHFNRQDTTDEKGSFRLSNIPEGSYYLRALLRTEGTAFYASRARQKVEVNGDNIEGLVLTVHPGTTIQGRLKVDGSVTVAPDRIHVALLPVDEDGEVGGQSEFPKKDGTFQIVGVSDGNYFLSVWGLENDGYIKSAQRGPDDLLEKGLQVEGGSSGKIEVTIGSDGAQLGGVVSNDDGPLIGARVRVSPDPLTPYNHLRIKIATTDQFGHFTFTNIAPGNYKLTATTMATAETAARKSEPQSVSLSENEHKTLDVKFEKPQE